MKSGQKLIYFSASDLFLRGKYMYLFTIHIFWRMEAANCARIELVGSIPIFSGSFISVWCGINNVLELRNDWLFSQPLDNFPTDRFWIRDATNETYMKETYQFILYIYFSILGNRLKIRNARNLKKKKYNYW